MTELLLIPYPKSEAGKKAWAKKYGMNAYYSGKHWAQRKADADYWHMLTLSALSMNPDRRIFQNPVNITFYWNDRLDLDNHSIIAKMIVDAMKGRIIKDDSRKYLKGVSHFWHNGDCIAVEIREVESAPERSKK